MGCTPQPQVREYKSEPKIIRPLSPLKQQNEHRAFHQIKKIPSVQSYPEKTSAENEPYYKNVYRTSLQQINNNNNSQYGSPKKISVQKKVVTQVTNIVRRKKSFQDFQKNEDRVVKSQLPAIKKYDPTYLNELRPEKRFKQTFGPLDFAGFKNK